MDSLMNQAIPGFPLLVFKRSIPESSPFLEQLSRRVLPGEVGCKRPFKASAKGHRGAGFLLSPSIEIAISITSRTAKILADLRMAKDHRRSFGVGSRRRFRRKVLPTPLQAQTLRGFGRDGR